MAQIREENMDWQQRDEYMQREDEKYLTWLQRIEDEEAERIRKRIQKRTQSLRSVALVFFLLTCVVALYIWYAPLLPEGW